MTGSVDYGSLPFREQIEHFRQKVNMPAADWVTLFEGQHARAFTIAGATKEALLLDFRAAVDKVIAEGVTLETFRKDFDRLVERHGWEYNGGRNWRSRVTYDTNLTGSYQAGRYQQLMQVRQTRPWWRYRHDNSVEHPRLQHVAWDGMILHWSDPFWRLYYPPSGWGCHCWIEALSDRDLQKLGRTGPDQAPAIEYETRTVGSRGPNPRTVRTPKGIDPGFGYSVGEAAYGKPLADDVMAAWRDQGAQAWESLTPKTYVEFGRPELVPLDAPRAQLAPPARDAAELLARVRQAIGGDERVFNVKGAPVSIVASTLAEHIEDLGRATYLPLLQETLDDPFEVWTAFEQHKGTGYVALRVRVVKAFDIGGGRSVLVVANARQGRLEAWTMIPTSDFAYVQRQRRGELMWGRDAG